MKMSLSKNVLLFVIFTGCFAATLPSVEATTAPEITCETLFEPRDFVPKVLERLKIASRSGLVPESRIVRDAVEIGQNGIYSITPADVEWASVKGHTIRTQARRTTVRSLEGHLRIEGKFADGEKTLSVQMAKPIVDSELSETGNSLVGLTHIKLRVSSSRPEQVHRLILIARGGEKFEVSFQAPENPIDIRIPVAQAPTLRDQVKLRFLWNPTGSQKFDLDIYGPISFERDVLSENPAARQVIEGYLDAIHLYGRLTDRSRLRSLVKKALANLRSPVLLEDAIVRAPAEIRSELEVMGIRRQVEFGTKADRLGFFLGDLNFRGRPWLKGPAVPIEIGEFARDHGSDTHSRQLFVILKTMNKKERTEFLDVIYGNLFGGIQRGWMAWDILFDAPGGSTPASPQWWRYQRELRGLSVDTPI